MMPCPNCGAVMTGPGPMEAEIEQLRAELDDQGAAIETAVVAPLRAKIERLQEEVQAARAFHDAYREDCGLRRFSARLAHIPQNPRARYERIRRHNEMAESAIAKEER